MSWQRTVASCQRVCLGGDVDVPCRAGQTQLAASAKFDRLPQVNLSLERLLAGGSQAFLSVHNGRIPDAPALRLTLAVSRPSASGLNVGKTDVRSCPS
jgi:hypothetical protein